MINVQVIIPKIPIVITNPMLAIPSCVEKAKPPKLDAVVNARENMVLAVLD